MSAQLEIRDGEPWWLSPDIWVVPSDDPNANPGTPIAGRANYLWARVRNTGDVSVTSARVDFFWSNPTTGVLRSNSTFVGSAFVDLDPGESKEVLCITPWIPVVVNDGHECVVAQIVHPADPLPTPLPDAFAPPSYLQVAQRNVTVLAMSSGSQMLIFPFQVSAGARSSKRKISLAVVAGERLGEELAKTLGLSRLEVADERSVSVAIATSGACGEHSTATDTTIDVPPGTSRALWLQVRSEDKFEGYRLFHVIEKVDGKEVGGLSVVVVHQRYGEKSA